MCTRYNKLLSWLCTQAIEPWLWNLSIYFTRSFLLTKNNIFTANLAEKIEVEEVKFKKSREYAVTDLSIHQDLDSKVITVTDADRLETISNLIQKLVKDKKELDLDLRIRNEETIEKVIRFQRKTLTKLSRLQLTLYNTSTTKMRKLNFTTTCLTSKNTSLNGKNRVNV